MNILNIAGYRFVALDQLDRGILNYFGRCGGAHFRGECFVFERRLALDAGLRQTGAATSSDPTHGPD